MSSNPETLKFLSISLLVVAILLWLCWDNRERFSATRGLNFAQGFSPTRGLNFAEGFINTPINSYMSTVSNRSLNDLEMTSNALGQKDYRKESVVGSKWQSNVNVPLSDLQKKLEGMSNYDDPSLNDVITEDPDWRTKKLDAMPSVTGMNAKWTDTAKDEINPMYGGFGMYAATTGRINTSGNAW